MSGSHLSKDFFNLVKQIGEAKSKQEEDRIVLTELQTLKQIISNDPGDLGALGGRGGKKGDKKGGLNTDKKAAKGRY